MKEIKKFLIGLFLVGSLVACGDDTAPTSTANIKPIDIGTGTEYLVGVPVGIKVVYDDGTLVTETVTWTLEGTSFIMESNSTDASIEIKAVETTGATTITAKYTPADETEVVETISISPSATAPTKIAITGRSGIAMVTELIKPDGNAGSTAIELLAYYGADGANQIKGNITTLATWVIANTPADAVGVSIDTDTSMLNVTQASLATGTKVTATYPVGNMSATADLTIATKSITSLFIVEESSDIGTITGVNVYKGSTTQLLAYAIYDSEGVPTPVYGAGIKWVSSTPANVGVGETTGVVTGDGDATDSSNITVESVANPSIKSAPAQVFVGAAQVPYIFGIVSIPTSAATGGRILADAGETPFTITVTKNDQLVTPPVTWEIVSGEADTNAAINPTTGVFTADTASDTAVVVRATIAANAIGNTDAIKLTNIYYVVTENTIAGTGTSNTNLDIKDPYLLVAGNTSDGYIETEVTYTTEPAGKVINPTGIKYSLAAGAGKGWAITADGKLTVGDATTKATITATVMAGGIETSNNSSELTATKPKITSVTVVRPAAPYPAAPAPLVIIGTGTMTLTTLSRMDNYEEVTPTTITWESGDTGIATVLNTGVVTGVAGVTNKTTIKPTVDGIQSWFNATVHVVPAL